MINRIIPLLLFIGFVWGQADLDKLVKERLGVEAVNSKVKSLTTEEYFELSRNTLALEEYQKLSTEEKGIYDAKSKNLGKWYLFGPMSTILLEGCVLLNMGLNDFSTPTPIFLGGSLAASLTIPYFVFNRKEKINFPKSILTDSEKEIYEQAYFKKLQERKFKYAVGSYIVAGGCALIILSSFSLSGFDMGPQPPVTLLKYQTY